MPFCLLLFYIIVIVKLTSILLYMMCVLHCFFSGKSKPRNFEISPTDECVFTPLVSQEEDERMAKGMVPDSKYIPLDPDNPTVSLKHETNVLDVLVLKITR